MARKDKDKEEGSPPDEVTPVPTGNNLPPSLEAVKGTAQEQVVRNWNSQAKSGTIYQCKESGCYYPVKPVRDRDMRPVVKKENGTEHFVMQCTWDPSHGGGEQLHKPFRKDDAID